MRHLIAVLIAATAWSIATPAAAAKLVVLTSTLEVLRPGAVIDGASIVILPAGHSLTLVSEDGRKVVLRGPFEGEPAPSAVKGDGTLLAALSRLISAPAQSGVTLGTTRSLNSGQLGTPGAWDIDTRVSGDICIQPGLVARLWRAEAAQRQMVSLKRIGGGNKIELRWAVDELRLAWPDTAEMQDGATYLLRLGDFNTARKMILHLVPDDLPTDAHRAVWMAKNGCQRQGRALLETLTW